MTRSKSKRHQKPTIRPVPKPEKTPRPQPWQKLQRFLREERPEYAILVAAYPDIRKEELSATLLSVNPTLEQCIKEMDCVYRRRFPGEADETYAAAMLKRGAWIPHAVVESRSKNPKKPEPLDPRVILEQVRSRRFEESIEDALDRILAVR